jgi:transposase
MIDATIIKAHPHAAGCLIAEQENEALGRSKGGFTTKLHAVVDALGLPVDVSLTGGHRNDITQAEPLMKDKTPDRLIADKGYDSDAFRAQLVEQGIEPVIPPRAKRKNPATYDEEAYKERHLVENFFLRIKFFRGIATRYCKTATAFLNLVKIACILTWVRF